MFTLATVRSHLTTAVDQYFDENIDFLKQDQHETAVTARLIPFLQSEFAFWPFDIDQNCDKRVLSGQYVRKVLDFLRAELPRSINIPIAQRAQMSVTKDIIPDIIFHDQNSGISNLLCIEIKKTTNRDKDDRKFDRIKLSKLTSAACWAPYMFGAFIDIPTGRDVDREKPSIKMYAQGQLIETGV